jgi:hypothetical protein
MQGPGSSPRNVCPLAVPAYVVRRNTCPRSLAWYQSEVGGSGSGVGVAWGWWGYYSELEHGGEAGFGVVQV